MRLFIALRFDDETLDRLEGIQDELRDAGIGGRYVPRENLHLTLLFIGDYKNPDEVIDILSEIDTDKYRLSVKGIGTYRDLYTAVLACEDNLRTYVKRIRHVLADNGIPFDRKKFNPHITLVRGATANVDTPEIPEVINLKDIVVESVSLMKSEQGKRGMVYTEIGTFAK